MLNEVTISLVTGFISGVLSGFLVYLFTKRRERKYQVYLYWETFLFRAIDDCQVYIPSESLRYISEIDKSGSDWHKAIHKILDLQNPHPTEEREFDERETKIAENVIIALEELKKWKMKNHLR